MGRITAFIYGAATYLLMFVTFLYLFAFLANMWVPKGVDDGVVGPFALALAVNIGLIVLFGVQHSVMARPGFKKSTTVNGSPLAMPTSSRIRANRPGRVLSCPTRITSS